MQILRSRQVNQWFGQYPYVEILGRIQQLVVMIITLDYTEIESRLTRRILNRIWLDRMQGYQKKDVKFLSNTIAQDITVYVKFHVQISLEKKNEYRYEEKVEMRNTHHNQAGNRRRDLCSTKCFELGLGTI